MKDNIIYIAAAVVVIFASVGLYRTTHKEVKEQPSPVEETVTFENPHEYYTSLLHKIDKGFDETAMPHLLGPDWKDLDYVVDADPKVQEEMDKTIWRYCLQTSDLFGTCCSYMKGENDYDNRLIGLLGSIYDRQIAYMNKYASERGKKSINVNHLKYEADCLKSVIDSKSQGEELLNKMTPMEHMQMEAHRKESPGHIGVLIATEMK